MWRRALVLWCTSRLVILALGVLVTQLGWHRILAPWQSQPWRALTGWDAVYYIHISHAGYGQNRSVAFFPLYPALIWLWRTITGASDAIASLAVANAATLAALAGLFVLARRRLSEAHARRAVLYLLLSPYAFVLAMAYSEGIFLALVVWLFVCLDRDHQRLAVPLAFACGLTRITALALIPALAVVAWQRRSPAVAAAALAPALAFGLHAAWLDHAVGDPLAMVHVQREWGGHVAFPLTSLVDQFALFAHRHDVFFLIRGLTTLGYLLLFIPLLRRPCFAEHRASDVLYVAGVFAMPLFSGILLSVGRFGLVAFPLFLVLAELGLRWPTAHRAYVVFAPIAQFIFFAAVALGYRSP